MIMIMVSRKVRMIRTEMMMPLTIVGAAAVVECKM